MASASYQTQLMNFKTVLCFVSTWRDWSSHHVRSLAEAGVAAWPVIEAHWSISERCLHQCEKEGEKNQHSFLSLFFVALDRKKQSAVFTDNIQ